MNKLSLIVFIIEIIILALIKMLEIDPVTSILTGLFIIIFSVVFCIDIKRSNVFRPYSTALICGYLFRIFLLFFDRYCQFIYQLPNSGADSETFYFNAMWLTFGLPSKRISSFTTLFKNIFMVIGTNRLFGQFLIVLFSVVAILYTVLIVEKIDNNIENKKKTIIILSLLPNFALLSSLFLRESLVCMLMTISFYNFINYYLGKSFNYFVYAIIWGLLAMLFHAGATGLLLGYLPILFLYDPKKKIIRLNISGMIIAIVFTIFILFLYSHYEDILFGKFKSAEKLEDIANTLQYGNTSYAKYVGDSSSIKNMILYTIPRLVFFLYSPFLPWQWRGLQDIIAFFFSGFFYLYVTYKLIIKIKEDKIRQCIDIISIATIIGCIVFIFAWGTANVGTAARHRDKIVTLFAILLVKCRDKQIE